MNIKRLGYLNSIKNAAFRNALLSHGLDDASHAAKVIDFIQKNPGQAVVNTTESRMTMYTAEINPYLYSDNSFITKSVNDAAFAASGNTKRLNDSVAGPTVTKGRVYSTALANGANAPAKTVKVRKNTGHDWTIEYFHTDPDALTMELTSEIPYEARGELLRAHADNLMQFVSNFTAVEWAQGAVGVAETIDITTGNDFFVLTSGAARTNPVTGNGALTVKKITKADIQAVKTALQRQQVTAGGTMYFLPTVEQYADIMEIPEFIDFEKTGRESRLIKGEVGMLYGMTILEPRHREDWNANILYSYIAPVVNDQDFTKVEDTAAAAVNMVSAGIAWVDNLVLRAQGSAIVFPWQNSPIYMGDVYASEMRYGAIKKRNDNKGVVMLLENPN